MTPQEQTLDIWKERHTLEQARRSKMRELMEEFDKEHYAKMAALRLKCAALGHNWRFTNFGPLGAAWYHCGTCGASRVETEE